MIKQTLVFSKPSSLSLRLNQLVIKLADSEVVHTRPIEDIGVVIVEGQQVKLTVPLINALAKNNVAVIFCDGNMFPTSMLMTLDGNTTLQESYKAQIDASLPMKKNLWKQLVEAKIKNQDRLLAKLGLGDGELKIFYQNVKSGDSDNREGAAARAYWGRLFPSPFVRDRDGVVPNNLLNYGYTILRAAVARAILGSGLFPAFALFHRNRYNSFPLADDLMEPFRPFVDEIVYWLYANGERALTTDVKNELRKVLDCDVKVGKVKRPLQIALTMMTASLDRVFKGGDNKLSLPMLE